MAHPQPGFYIVDEPGMEAVDQEGRSWPYLADAITMIPPWFRYSYRFIPRQTHAFLHVSMTRWPGSVLRGIWPNPVYLRDAHLITRFRIWAQTVAEDAPAAHQHLLGNELAWSLITAVVTSDERAREQLLQGERSWRELAPAIELVERELHRPLATTEIGAALGVGREHCARLFRRHLGQSPVGYVQERRVARASELLRETDWSLERIAHACGCGSRQHLTRLFRRHLHSTPTAWRGG